MAFNDISIFEYGAKQMNGVLEGKAATSCSVSACNTGIRDTRT